MTNPLSKMVTGLSGSIRVTALDIGARGGAKDDLALIAPMVDYYLFEPELTAAERLRGTLAEGNWHSTTVIGEALGAREGTFPLNLYRQRGCSSKFTADRDLAKLFSRGDYYIHDGIEEVSVRPLDDLVADGTLSPPDFMKIDVQGMENEVFDGASKALETTLVGVRAEVSFFPLYKDQPLFADIDQQLRRFNFTPMRWIELHEWRRCTRAKYPLTESGAYPASRGQMIHGDVLYLLHPESLPYRTDKQRRRLVRLGLIAMSYGHIDHAMAAFTRPGVSEFMRECSGIEPETALSYCSKSLARKARYEHMHQRVGRWVARLLRVDA